MDARLRRLLQDLRGAITEALAGAVARCDAVVTSGGVSMGEVDLVRVVLDQMGEPDEPFRVISGNAEGKRFVDLDLIQAVHARS